MNFQRRHIIVLSLITIISVIGLMYIQWQWLRNGAVLSQDLTEKKMGLLLQEIKEQLKPSIPVLQEFTGGIKGEQLIFVDPEQYSEAEKRVVQTVDEVLRHNSFSNRYTLKGKITDGPCIFHSIDHGPYKEDWLIHNPNQICLCHYIHDGTFDFVLQLDQKRVLRKEAAGLLLPSMLFLLLLSGTLFYTIYTISRQKKLSELKTDFINNLTHEFKTPIFTIGLSSGMLGKAEAIQNDQKLRSYVDLISRENQRLRNQVDKVLQMAVIDSGNLTLERKPININAMLENIADSFRVAVESKEGQIDLHLATESLVADVDETHLSNAFYNLVDNAYKYSRQKPEINISTAQHDGTIKIVISDKGIGMSKEILQKIFDRFYRAQRANVHDVKGFGLGLSYVRTIIELHKGKIEVKSKKDKGTTFSIQLPVT